MSQQDIQMASVPPRKRGHSHQNLDVEGGAPVKSTSAFSKALILAVTVAGCVGAALAIGLVFGLDKDNNNNNNGGGSSPSSSPSQVSRLQVPRSIQVIDTGSNGASTSARHLNLLNVPDHMSSLKNLRKKISLLSTDDYSSQTVQTETDITTEQNGFTHILSFAEMVMCVISKTGYDQQANHHATDYYDARIDVAACSSAQNGGNTTQMLDFHVNTYISGGRQTIKLFSPGYIGVPYAFNLYGDITEEDEGFTFQYDLDNAEAPRNETGQGYWYSRHEAVSIEKGYLRYFNENKYQLVTTNTRHTFSASSSSSPYDGWKNYTSTISISASDNNAIVSQDSTVTGCTRSAGCADGTESFAYALSYSGDYANVQNCTSTCTDVSSLPIVASSSQAGAKCYSTNDYTEFVEGAYCLYDTTTGSKITTEIDWPGVDYTHTTAADRRNSSANNGVTGKVTYHVYGDGEDCYLSSYRCTQTQSYCSQYLGNGTCAQQQSYCTNYDFDGGIGGRNGFDIKDGTIIGSYKAKATRVKRVVNEISSSSCSNVPVAVPSLTHHTSLPPAYSTPAHKGTVCGTAGSRAASVIDGVHVGSTTFFTPVAC